jgi:dUTPase
MTLFKSSHPLPVRATKRSVGYDIVGISREWNDSKTQITYDTGISLGDVPEGFFAALFPKSSIVTTDLRLANSVGVIDPDYTGTIKVVFDVPAVLSDWLSPGNAKIYAVGDAVAQIVFLPFLIDDVIEPVAERGEGGFGSTTKKGKK